MLMRMRRASATQKLPKRYPKEFIEVMRENNRGKEKKKSVILLSVVDRTITGNGIY